MQQAKKQNRSWIYQQKPMNHDVVNVGTTTIRVPNLLMRSCLCLRALQSVALSALCKQLACCSNHGCSAVFPNVGGIAPLGALETCKGAL